MLVPLMSHVSPSRWRSLDDELVLYGAYHNNLYNQIVHAIFVPLILWSTATFLEMVRVLVVHFFLTRAGWSFGLFTRLVRFCRILFHSALAFRGTYRPLHVDKLNL